MVFVFHQMLVSALLYLSNKLKALALNVSGEERRRGLYLTDQAQNALAELCTAKDLLSFTLSADNFLHCLLPEATDILVFTLNPETDELEALSQNTINSPKLPGKGIARQVFIEKKKVQISTLPSDDPLAVLIPSSTCSNYENNNQQVILSPLLNKDGQLFMLIVAVCPGTEQLESYLDFAEKQLINSLTQVLDRRKELDYFTRQRTFLETFGKSIETKLENFSHNLCSFVKSQIKSEFAVLLLLDQASGELYNRYETDGEEMRIEVAGSIFEEPVIQSKSMLCLSNISQKTKERFDIGRITDHYVQSLLCSPVVSLKTNEVTGIVCTFNKELPANRFTKEDESNLKFCCNHIAGLLENTLEWEKEMVIKRQQEKLLQVAKNLFNRADDVSLLLNEIMTEARSLTNAERCSLFLVDHEHNELVAKVFDGEIPGNGKHKEGWDLTIPINQGIVGHVAVTGKLLNIKDTYNHPLFYRGLDEKTGFRTKSILCFPIKGEEGVIGVAELCNKVNGGCFTKFDEDLTKAFAIYCGISIFQSMLYKKASSAWHRSQVTSELMIYHMNVPQHEVDDLLKLPIQEHEQFTQDFSNFAYMPRTLAEDQTIPAVLFMMDDLGFIDRWKIPKEILIRFTMMVKRGYRDPPYHNWYHAFSVAHYCYLLYKNTDMEARLTDLERLALFVACLCHDLDHRGTNNAFQVSSNSTLAALYSSEGSVMERHHFAQTVCILNSSGCNIFKNLSESNFEKVLDLIRTIILATDLAHHLKILKDIRRIAQDGYKTDRQDHHNLLLCLMMTASDLSDQTKPWEGTRKIADLIYTEFFSQGDLEKVMGYTPSEMMDRERACIPKLQIDFLESIALPVYSALGDIIPETSIVYDTVLSNRDHWKVVQEESDEQGVIDNI